MKSLICLKSTQILPKSSTKLLFILSSHNLFMRVKETVACSNKYAVHVCITVACNTAPHTQSQFSSKVFFLGEWGVSPSGENFVNPPPIFIPVFGPRLRPPAEVHPRNFEKFKYSCVSNLATFKLKSILNKAVLEPRVSPAFAITYFCNHCNIRFENTSKYVDTLTLFSKNLNQRSLTPRWPLTPCLLRSHVWLYPRIIVSKSHDNTSMYVDTVINFAKYHIHTHTYYILHTHTTYRMSDHIVSYWTQFRRDKNCISNLKFSKIWPNFALGGQFWLQSDFHHKSPPPHQKFRGKTLQVNRSICCMQCLKN